MQNAQRRKTVENQSFNRLLQTALAGKELNEIVDAASDYLNNPLVIISAGYHIIAYSKKRKAKDFTWLEATRRGYITVEFAATLNHWEELASHRYLDVDKISRQRRRFYRLIYRQKIVGFLNVTEETCKLEDIDETNYQFVVDLLAKEIAFSQNSLAYGVHLKEEELLLELVENHFVNRVHFLERIKSMPIEAVEAFQVGLIDFSQQISYNAGKDQIQEAFLAYLPNATWIIYKQTLILLLKDPQSINEEALKKTLIKKHLILGLSDVFEDLYCFQSYLEQAQVAVRLQNLLEKKQAIARYNEVRTYHMFEHFNHDELLRFCHPSVMKLKYYDEKNQTEYLPTLHAYLHHQQSIQKTAQALFVHRNTIHYRVSKICDLTGLDFQDSFENYQLMNSCEILHFLDHFDRVI